MIADDPSLDRARRSAIAARPAAPGRRRRVRAVSRQTLGSSTARLPRLSRRPTAPTRVRGSRGKRAGAEVVVCRAGPDRRRVAPGAPGASRQARCAGRAAGGRPDARVELRSRRPRRPGRAVPAPRVRSAGSEAPGDRDGRRVRPDRTRRRAARSSAWSGSATTCGWRPMFTGIVEERGTVLERGGRSAWWWRAAPSPPDSAIGASVAVNGVCLTVVAARRRLSRSTFPPETLARSTPSAARARRPREPRAARDPRHPAGRPPRAGARRRRRARSTRVERRRPGRRRGHVAVPAGLLRYVVEKGSITVDGVSLTVAALAGDGIGVALIPHTLAATTLGAPRRRPGEPRGRRDREIRGTPT